MKIGIIGAMQEEVQLLIKDISVTQVDNIGMREYYSGTLYDRDVVIVFSRWGKVAAASTVTTLIEKFNVDLVLFTGIAGAANDMLNIGDIVIADKLVQHDMDCSAVSWLKKFEIPLLGKAEFEVMPDYIALAASSASYYIENEMRNEIGNSVLKEFMDSMPKVIVGTIASGDRFIADKEIIKSFASEIENLQCVEMEGAAVAQICYEHKVDYAVFRVISDKADQHANINCPAFIEKAASYFTRGIIKQFVKSV